MIRIVTHPIRPAKLDRAIDNARIRAHIPESLVPGVLSQCAVPDPTELSERDVQFRAVSRRLARASGVDAKVEVVQAGEDGLDECVAGGGVCAESVDVCQEERARVCWRGGEDADLGKDDLRGCLQVRFAVDCRGGDEVQ